MKFKNKVFSHYFVFRLSQIRILWQDLTIFVPIYAKRDDTVGNLFLCSQRNFVKRKTIFIHYQIY